MHDMKAFGRCTLRALPAFFFSISFAGNTLAEPAIGNPLDANEVVLGLALTAGGDDLAEVRLLYDSGSVETETIEAGGFIYFYGGMQFNTPLVPLRLTLGYLEDSVDASNGSISFSRFPLELMGLFTTGPHTFGVGPTYHLSPELDVADIGFGNFDADNALGLVLMYEYTLQSNVGLGLRYTDISYDFEGEDVDGSSVGLQMELKF